MYNISGFFGGFQMWKHHLARLMRAIGQLTIWTVRSVVNFLWEVTRDGALKPLRAWVKKNFFWVAAGSLGFVLFVMNPKGFELIISQLIIPIGAIWFGLRMISGKSLPFSGGGKKKRR